MGDGQIAGGVLLTLALGAAAVELILRAGGSPILTIILAGAFVLIAAGLLIYWATMQRSWQKRAVYSAVMAFVGVLTVDSFAVLSAGYQQMTSWVLLGVAAAWTVLWLPVRFRQLTATTRFTFASDAAMVFGFLSDFSTQTHYMQGVDSVEQLTSGPVGLGTRFRTRVNMGRGSLAVDEVMTVFERDRRYASQIEGDPMTGTATFEPFAQGTLGTFQVTTTLSYTEALLGMGLLRPVIAKQMQVRRRAAWARVNEILKRATP